MKKILVVDGQGGRLGAEIISKLIEKNLELEIIAVGTNAIATSEMIKKGAKLAATGENPLVFNSQEADVIVGPIGIVIANSLLGEISPKMAVAVGSSKAKKILVPMNKCDNFVIASQSFSFSDLVEKAVEKIINEL